VVKANHAPVTPIQARKIRHGNRFHVSSGPQGMRRIERQERNVSCFKIPRDSRRAKIDPASPFQHRVDRRQPTSRQGEPPGCGQLAFTEEPSLKVEVAQDRVGLGHIETLG